MKNIPLLLIFFHEMPIKMLCFIRMKFSNWKKTLLLGFSYIDSINNCLRRESRCVKKFDSFYIYRYVFTKVRFNKEYSEEKKEGIFRGNVGRLWSLFHSFDRLPLQDNEGKRVEGEKGNSTGRKWLKYDTFNFASLQVLNLTHSIPSYSPWR